MFNWKYIAILFGAVVIFNSCVNRQENFSAQQTQPATNIHQPYGAYVAGRVAHLRRDYNSAADYYIKAVDADPNNTELLSSVYLILASQSRVDEAAQFAKKSLAQGDKNQAGAGFLSPWRGSGLHEVFGTAADGIRLSGGRAVLRIGI